MTCHFRGNFLDMFQYLWKINKKTKKKFEQPKEKLQTSKDTSKCSEIFEISIYDQLVNHVDIFFKVSIWFSFTEILRCNY